MVNKSTVAVIATSLRLGVLFIALGIAFNYWLLRGLFVADDRAGAASTKFLVSEIDILVVIVGLLLIKCRHRIGSQFMILRLITWTVIIGGSVIAGSVLVFFLTERYPGLASRCYFRPIMYYSNRDSRFMADPDLVVRKRPLVTYDSSGLRGDLYASGYGCAVDPLTYRSSLDANGFRNDRSGDTSAIVIVGDAFIEMGNYNSDTCGCHLERFSGLTTTNVGTGWYGSYQYLVLLKR